MMKLTAIRIKLFDSINEASQSVNLTPSAIGNCCSGKRKTAGGYHWKYVEEK